jgi:hypothetical protein
VVTDPVQLSLEAVRIPIAGVATARKLRNCIHHKRGQIWPAVIQTPILDDRQKMVCSSVMESEPIGERQIRTDRCF